MGKLRDARTGNLFAKICGSSGVQFLKVLFWSELYLRSPTVTLDRVLSPAMGDGTATEIRLGASGDLSKDSTS